WEYQVINGAFIDVIADVQGDLLLIQGAPVEGNNFNLKRIGTTISKSLSRTLFTSGVNTALDITTQKRMKESNIPIKILSDKFKNEVVEGKIDFNGAYGNYYREIFFHIP